MSCNSSLLLIKVQLGCYYLPVSNLLELALLFGTGGSEPRGSLPAVSVKSYYARI